MYLDYLNIYSMEGEIEKKEHLGSVSQETWGYVSAINIG